MEDSTELETLLQGPIPVLSNRLILRLIGAGLITIDPFDVKKLGSTAYRLCPHRLRFPSEYDDEGLLVDSEILRLTPGASRHLRPGEHVVVSPEERIALAPGLVADFYPSSWCVENRLIVTAGRLDSGYDKDLVFGVFNAGRSDVTLTADFQLARATFSWLGSANVPEYTATPPGAYIVHLDQLRRREAELDTAEEALRRQRKEIERRREEILRQSE